MVAEGPGRVAAAALRFPTPLERKYPRAGHSWPWFWVLRSTRIRPIHGAVSCASLITCMTRSSARLQTCRRTSRHHEARHTAHPPPRSRRPAPQRLAISNRAGSAGISTSTTMIYTHVLKAGGAASNGRLRKVLPASAGMVGSSPSLPDGSNLRCYSAVGF